ncbi:uncharacterized protein LOC126999209 isoform X2 [Eriocheir sinensis]|uniref:uncharacterized protein LOC126999209 isoform X2 n=1 Tax=Eriocheir sinensis TaxID=95602 RepID=UPI0021C73CD8|nr:uncharacterized protein LOC126999209 isoform X2 [Eriocheir sinensis]
MDENVVFPSMGSTDSLQQESVPKAKSGSGQQLGQRSPLKDILNTSPSQPRVMKTAGMPSRFESVRQLDEEAEWRERTEVVTALDHHHNKGMARDLLEQALLGAVNRSQTRTDAGPVAFREVKNVSVMDSGERKYC